MPAGAKRVDVLVPAALVLVLLGMGLRALPEYSVTWDEALADLFFGERYLSFFTSFDHRYLDFAHNPYPPERFPDLSVAPFRSEPHLFYPVADTLAAASAALFSRSLGLLDPFDGFHALNLLLGSILVVALYRFAASRFGRPAAVAAVALLFLSPRVVGDLLSNIKDFPEMVFFSLSVMAVAEGLETGSGGHIVGGGLLWGLALGTKANAVFLPAIPALTLLLWGCPAAWRGRGRGLVASLAAAIVAGPAVWFASWPWLWADPVVRLARNLTFYARRGTGAGVASGSIQPPFEALVLTTPVPFLLLFSVGVAALAARRETSRRGWLLLVWIAVVAARVQLPGSRNFDGVRHFLEIMPPMAMTAGIGASRLASELAASGWLRRWSLRPHLLAAVAGGLAFAAPLASMSWSLRRIHPFELAYWNALAGGLGGARSRGMPQAGDYYAASYRTAIRWLNAKAPPGSALAVPVAEHVVRLTAPAWLRPDIELLHTSEPSTPRVAGDARERLNRIARRRPLFVFFALRSDWTNAITDRCAALTPEMAWERDGVPILAVYRWPAAARAEER